jgi:DNA-binding transcriptional MerR regulator
MTEPLWFRIGYVCRTLGVKPSAIRYWESEFSRWVRPGRTKKGQRVYSRVAVERLKRIQQLLHVERYTIERARMRMATECSQAEAAG